eukprot:4191429-Lingulodinium_polyedra.AAC.1
MLHARTPAAGEHAGAMEPIEPDREAGRIWYLVLTAKFPGQFPPCLATHEICCHADVLHGPLAPQDLDAKVSLARCFVVPQHCCLNVGQLLPQVLHVLLVRLLALAVVVRAGLELGHLLLAAGASEVLLCPRQLLDELLDV